MELHRFLNFPLFTYLILACIAPWCVAQDILISEFMAANSSDLLDEDGNTSDWIELFNASGSSVNLVGWTLTDDASNPVKWTFPAVTLTPGQYLVIFASDKDRAVAGSELHTNFKLGASGEYLGLFRPGSGTAEDAYTPLFPPQFDDISYGRKDGETGYFLTPTPGSANGTVNPGLVSDTHFSPDRGYYSSPFSLTIQSDTPGAQIRYTMDGSVPTLANGTTYSTPIPINKSTVVRARAYFSDWLPSDIDTQTYIFPNSVFTQSSMPSGFPDTWGGGIGSNELMAADYEMDAEVTGNPAYSGLLSAALTSLPAISVVMSIEDWFDPTTGIYSNGSLEGPDWERAGSVEMFLPDNSTVFAVRTGIQIQGDSSTEPDWKIPKLSMRLLFQDQYGPSKLNYRVFEDSELEAFDTLVLDARSNMTWLHPTDAYQRVHAQYTRDAVMNDLQLATGHLSPHNRYAHLFLNGLYWGIYAMHERPDDNFMAAYRGGGSGDYDVMRHFADEVVAGTDTDYQAMMAFARETLEDANGDTLAYRTIVDHYLELPAYIDYMLINYWAGNTDWARHNWYVGGDISGGRKFEYYSWDAEHVLKDVNTNVLGDNRPGSPTELFHLLSQNSNFRRAFADRAYSLMFNNGLLTPDVAWSIYANRADEIDPAVILESARWGDHRRDHHPVQPVANYDLYTRDDYWTPERVRLRDDYFPQRTGIVIGQFRNAGLYPSIDPPQVELNNAASQGGVAQLRDMITLVNPNGTGIIYYTLDGRDPRGEGSAPVLGQLPVFEESATKRVLVPSVANGGSGLGLSWTGGNEPFEDSGWIQGTGGVGYDTSSTYVGLYGIDVESQVRNINGSCFVRIPFNLSAMELDSLIGLRLTLRIDDGFVAWINGVEVARQFFDGTPQWNSLSNGDRPDGEVLVEQTLDLIGAHEVLHVGENILAVQMLNTSLSSSDFLLTTKLEGITQTPSSGDLGAIYAGPIEFERPLRLRSRVLSDGEWSALSDVTFQLVSQRDSLRVTQLMYHPPDLPLGHPDAEYIRMTNISDSPVLLSGVRFVEGVQCQLADELLAAGESTMVIKDFLRFLQWYGPHPDLAGVFERGSLANGGERLKLVDDSGATIQDFVYSDWYPATDGDGAALEIINPRDPDLGHWNLPESWQAVQPQVVPISRAESWLDYD